MIRPRLVVYWVFVGSFVGTHLWHAWNGVNNWPVASYNMFAFGSAVDASVLRVALEDSSGAVIIVRPGQTVPVEFFRAPEMLLSGLVRTKEEKSAELCSYLLARLNEHPWKGWDETLPSARPKGGYFVKMRLLAVPLEDIAMGCVSEERSQLLFSYGHIKR